MDRIYAQGLATSSVSQAERWEHFKPIILDLYIRQDMPLTTLIDIMRNQYDFHAVEHTYKYYLGQWGVTKNIPSSIKDAAIVALGKRLRENSMSTPDVTYKGYAIDKKRIRRHISTGEKKKEAADNNTQLGNNVFITWNLPYRAFKSSSPIIDHASPIFPPTPTLLKVSNSTSSNICSPNNTVSPKDHPTPTTLAIRNMELENRARLFVQAKHEDLMKQMGKVEKRMLTTYLYQFWLFAFKTAKYWGYGPREWNFDLLEFDQFRERDHANRSAGNTPRSIFGTPLNVDTPASEDTAIILARLSTKPPPLCRWTIHAAIRNRYDGEEFSDDEEDSILGPDGEESLGRWSPNGDRRTFEERLQKALESNEFSNLKPEEIPMAMARIVKATRHSQKELLQESFGFSIVARNEDVFWRLLPKVAKTNLENTGIYPLHLLTSFLDGSKACCNLLDAALNSIAENNNVQRLFVNDHGHTVLDNLMLTILKSHTSCLPFIVDDNLAKMKRFTGEEVDICGRWDADSPCVRELFAEGQPRIPLEWKHMFCHTSAQAVCHSIGRVYGPVFAPDIDHPSGLFIKKCQACGKELRLRPLHTLVLIAFYLARSGCPGENLFGMLACLTCLLANGADPQLKAHISLDALRNRDNATECSHELLDPFELSERVPESLLTGWTEDSALGWKALCTLLRHARDERRDRSKPSRRRNERIDDFRIFIEISDDELSKSSDTEGDESDGEVDEELCQHSKPTTGNFYGGSKTIGILWAAIQTELATYRRLTEEDPWISRYFDMRSLLDGLSNGGTISIPLVEDSMMAPFCECGRFFDVTDEACPCVDEVCSPDTDYFANLDVWSRSTYIMIPENYNESWYDFS